MVCRVTLTIPSNRNLGSPIIKQDLPLFFMVSASASSYNAIIFQHFLYLFLDLETQEEIQRLSRVVDDFAEEMKVRLREQAIKGYRGWDDTNNYRRILAMMMEHTAVSSGQEVDAANLAMILWYLRRQEGFE